MFRTLFVAMALVVIGAGSAQAQSLYVVSINDDGLTLVDRDSLRWRDNRPQIVYHVILQTPYAFPKAYGGGYDWAQGISFKIDFDCSQRRYKSLDTNFFDFNQRPIDHVAGDGKWETFEPGSDIDAIQALACRNELPTDINFPGLADAAYTFYDVLNSPEE